MPHLLRRPIFLVIFLVLSSVRHVEDGASKKKRRRSWDIHPV